MFGYENNNFNQIYLFLLFFLWKTNCELLLRLEPVEGASERTNDVYCHIAKGNLSLFCKMYF